MLCTGHTTHPLHTEVRVYTRLSLCAVSWGVCPYSQEHIIRDLIVASIVLKEPILLPLTGYPMGRML